MLTPHIHSTNSYLQAISSYLPKNIAANFNYQSSTSSADDIQSQILKSDDPALKFVRLIEDGSFNRTWEQQKKIPAATWPQDIIDRICGWGRFYFCPETSKTENTEKRSLPESPKFYCDSKGSYGGIQATFPTALKTEKYTNSCLYINPTNYKINIHALRGHISSNSLYCRIETCVNKKLLSCQPNCFPCINASGKELTEKVEGYFSNSHYNEKKSELVHKLIWSWMIWSENYSPLLVWKVEQVDNLVKEIFHDCESLEAQESLNNRIVMVVSGLGLVGIYALKRVFNYLDHHKKVRDKSSLKKFDL